MAEKGKQQLWPEIFGIERQLEQIPGESLSCYTLRKLHLRRQLSTFYNHLDVKRRKFVAEQRYDREEKRIFQALLRMVGGCSSKKVDPNAWIVVGSGGFDVGSGPTGKFEARLLEKFRSLGYNVLIVNEYRYVPHLNSY